MEIFIFLKQLWKRAKKDPQEKTREYTRQAIKQYEKTLRRLSYE